MEQLFLGSPAKRPRLLDDHDADALCLLASLTSDQPRSPEEAWPTCQAWPVFSEDTPSAVEYHHTSDVAADTVASNSETSPTPSEPLSPEEDDNTLPGRMSFGDATESLFFAVCDGDVGAVQACLACYTPDVSYVFRHSGRDAYGDDLEEGDEWALDVAAREGHLACAQLVLEAGGSPVDVPEELGGDPAWADVQIETPLMAAARRCDVDMVELLLHHGANPLRLSPQGGYTAYDIAERHGEGTPAGRQCMRLLLDAMHAIDEPGHWARCRCPHHHWEAEHARARPVAGSPGVFTGALPPARPHPRRYHDVVLMRVLDAESYSVGPSHACAEGRAYRPSCLGPNRPPSPPRLRRRASSSADGDDDDDSQADSDSGSAAEAESDDDGDGDERERRGTLSTDADEQEDEQEVEMEMEDGQIWP